MYGSLVPAHRSPSGRPTNRFPCRLFRGRRIHSIPAKVMGFGDDPHPPCDVSPSRVLLKCNAIAIDTSQKVMQRIRTIDTENSPERETVTKVDKNFSVFF